MEKLKNKKMAVRLLWATFGSLLFAAGVNIIILPLHLYNGKYLEGDFSGCLSTRQQLRRCL